MKESESWEILGREPVLNQPFIKVDMETIRLPDGRIIEDWPRVHARDYVNVLVFNGHGQAMILEGYKHGLGRSSWQVVGGYLEGDEPPLAAVQRELLEETGFVSHDWRYLGSYVIDANRYVSTGHFFVAFDARPGAEPNHDDLEQFGIRWVSIDELKYALLDGRVGVISYAVNICLALMSLERIVKERTLRQLFPQYTSPAVAPEKP